MHRLRATIRAASVRVPLVSDAAENLFGRRMQNPSCGPMALGHPGPAPHSRECGNPYGRKDGKVGILHGGAYRYGFTGSMGSRLRGDDELNEHTMVSRLRGNEQLARGGLGPSGHTLKFDG